MLTGENGAVLHGSHFGPWIPVRLRPLVEEHSLLRQAVEAGYAAAFANAYPRDWPGTGRRRVAGPPLAAQAAGLLTRDHTRLRTGEAVASEIVNDGWRRWAGVDAVPETTAEAAGRVLGDIASSHLLTLFAHYATDTAGHRGGMDGAVSSLERVDAFLAGVLDRLPAEHALMIVSDHGNIEDVRGGHTRNPALGLLVGPEAGPRASRLKGLQDVAPQAMEWLAA